MYTLMAAIRRKLWWSLALTAVSVAAHAQDAGRTLTDLDFVALDGGRVQMTLTLSEAAPQSRVRHQSKKPTSPVIRSSSAPT